MLQIAVTLIIIVAIAPIFGASMAQVFLGKPTFLDRFLTPIESLIYRVIRPGSQETMTGWEYIRAILYSNLVMGIWVYLILILQGILPLNPTNLAGVNWDLALHTTISFLTNTNQQHYAGETTLSYASQVLALGFLMFTSAGTGLSVGIAFIRGVTGRNLGNFYVDLTQSITRILLPISLISALLLLLSGVPETLANPVTVTTLEGNTQIIAVGSVAHFESIKQLGEMVAVFSV